MKRTKENVYKKIAIWFASNDTGLSSETMAKEYLTGDGSCGYVNMINYPLDPADIGRCFRLIRDIPEIKSALPSLAKKCKRWEVLYKNWDSIEQQMEEEVGIDWSKNGRAQKTNDLMHNLMKGTY